MIADIALCRLRGFAVRRRAIRTALGFPLGPQATPARSRMSHNSRTTRPLFRASEPVTASSGTRFRQTVACCGGGPGFP